MRLQPPPRLLARLHREASDWRRWWTRGVVLLAAVASGLAVVAFTWLTEEALSAFAHLSRWSWWLPLLWTPVLTAGIVWVTRRWFAGAAGSGIPQVMAALRPEVDEARRGLFVDLRLALVKIVLTAAGLLGGLSVGREGPSVQVGAGVMAAFARWLPERSGVTPRALLVAGGAGGIAAAFNAPLAGVMFAIEELARSPEHRSSGLLVSAIVLSGLMAVSVFGNLTYFGVIHPGAFGWAMLWPALAVAVAAGLAGGLFARLLLASLAGQSQGPLNRWRARQPVLFAGACGLGVAVIGLASDGLSWGSGYASTKALLEGAVAVPLVYVLLKFVATWWTAWSGVPAGIFAPSLAIGAALGSNVAVLSGHAGEPGLIALGMAGFLAAATQAPLTAFIIVMEMVDGHQMVLSLMACALVASGVSRLVTRPLYAGLAEAQRARLPG